MNGVSEKNLSQETTNKFSQKSGVVVLMSWGSGFNLLIKLNSETNSIPPCIVKSDETVF